MMKINRTLSKVGLSLCTALLLSGAGGSAARASSIPTSSDEARALPTNVSTRATAAIVKGVASTTDEARAVAGYSLPISITAAVSRAVTSTDEARALAGEEIQIVGPEQSRAIASTR
jgi:hypothetical protein